MESEERRIDLYFKLIVKRKASIHGLAHDYGTSISTIRKDLDILRNKLPHITIRGRNGGVVVDSDFRPPFPGLSQHHCDLLLHHREAGEEVDEVIEWLVQNLGPVRR